MPLVSEVLVTVLKSVHFDPAVPFQGIYSKEVISGVSRSGAASVLVPTNHQKSVQKVVLFSTSVGDKASPADCEARPLSPGKVV